MARWEQDQPLERGGEDEARGRCQMALEMIDVQAIMMLRLYLDDEEMDPEGHILEIPDEDDNEKEQDTDE